jgi:site-specific DNA recombinase
MSKKLKKAIIYIRVSTDDQASDGHISLEVQEKQCAERAKSLGYKVFKVFKDPGFSGGTLKRPGLQEMLNCINKNIEIDALFIQHTDRLARDVAIHQTIKSELRKHNVQIHSLTQGFLKDTPDDNMVDGMLSVINAHQRELTSYKTKMAMQQKAKNGWLPKLPPIGYLNATVKNEKIIIIDKIKAPLIKKLFKLYLTGNYTGKMLSDKFYPLGLTSHKGNKIHTSKIHKMLKEKFYLGELKYGDIHVKKANHTPIIDENLFNAVQNMIQIKNNFACRQRKHNFLLRGFIYCNKCDGRYTAEKHAKKNKSYYHCCNNKCDDKPKYIEAAQLEDLVSLEFKKIILSEDFINEIIAKIKDIYKDKKRHFNSKQQGFINKKNAVEKKREVIEEKLVAGVLSNKDFTRINDRYEAEISTMNSMLLRLESNRKIDLNKIKNVLNLTKNIYDSYLDADKEIKRQYLGLFWEKITVSEREIRQAKPSKLFDAMIKLQKAYLRETKKSPYEEEFFIPSSPLLKQKVIIRNSWGPIWELN